MTAPSAPFHDRYSSPINHDAIPSRLSSGTLSGRPFDVMRYRAIFPDRWSAFLRAHFRDAVHVAFTFSVDEKCARNWINGTTGPSGVFVAVAIATIPGAAEHLIPELMVA